MIENPHMKKIIWLLLGLFCFGMLAGFAGLAAGQDLNSDLNPNPHPVVAVTVAVQSQLATEDEAAVLPDDFARNDPPRVSAEWVTPAPSTNPGRPSQKMKEVVTRELISKSDLQKWVAENYPAGTKMTRGFMAGNSRVTVWQHLVNDHGFLPVQINGLSRWEADSLHDAVHPQKDRNGAEIDPPKITAFRAVVRMVPDLDGIPQASSCAPAAPDDVAAEPEFILYTADGTWTCNACNVQKGQLASGGEPGFKYKTVRVPAEGQSPTGAVPCWKAPDGDILRGNHSTSALNAWAAKHRPAPTKTPDVKVVPGQVHIPAPVVPVTEVNIDSESSSAVLAALAAHVQRMQEIEKTTAAAGNLSGGFTLLPQRDVQVPAVRSWLPELDIDLDDSLLKILDGLLKPGGYQSGGLTVGWPASAAATRSITFSPPVAVRFRKILEVDVELKSVAIEGRVLTLNLTGKFLSTLKVRLK